MICWQNYILYLVLQILQTIVSNVVINIFCRKLYKDLSKVYVSKNCFIEIWQDIKNVFSGKIASYIYSSTDNIVISTFVNTTCVGYYVNYTTIVISIKTIISSILNPIIPAIGNELVKNNNNKYKMFWINTHVRYIISVTITVPTIILIQDFVGFCFGKKYILPIQIVYLIAIELYIHIIQGSCYDFIMGSGLFKYNKYIELSGAIANITLSIILVNILGLPGVIVGTIISQIFFWILRSLLVYKCCFKLKRRNYINYWVVMILYIFIFNFIYRICMCLYSKIYFELFYVQFIIGGIICEFICIGICILLSLIIIYIKRKKD